MTMSNFLNIREGLGSGNKAEELEGKQDNSPLKPREFFWDNIVLFVVSSIIGLAAIDVITEFIRGGGVACFAPFGIRVSEAQENYINNFCAGSLPLGVHIPIFMVIHAILIAVPHYLWLNHYGGNFEFFFQLASSLRRLRDKTTGKHVPENRNIVQQLENVFSTYNRNTIFYLYIGKLAVQLVWCLAGFAFVVGFFFENFSANFICPATDRNPLFYSDEDFEEFWPLDGNVTCTFETLRLLSVLWGAEIGLLLFASFGLVWALFWCFSIHTSELGSHSIAVFCFQSGLTSNFYVPKLPVPSCLKPFRLFLHRFITSIPWLSFSRSDPLIRNDLDFLVMKLFRTDSGLGQIFRDVQVEKELKYIIDDDQRRLDLHSRTQMDPKATTEYSRKIDLEYQEGDDEDLKWRFKKETGGKGIYDNFDSLTHLTQPKLKLTNTMRGAVLGYGARAPHNSQAISISFGDAGYATALARVFKWVAHLNFSPSYRNPNEVVSVRHYYSNIISLVFAEDVLSSETDVQNKFKKEMINIWVRPNLQVFHPTAYIVVSPIPKEKKYHRTNVDLLLKEMEGCIQPGAILLTIQPSEIAGKNVANSFLPYEPPNEGVEYFKWHKEEELEVNKTKKGLQTVSEWQAKKRASAVTAPTTPPPPTTTTSTTGAGAGAGTTTTTSTTGAGAGTTTTTTTTGAGTTTTTTTPTTTTTTTTTGAGATTPPPAGAGTMTPPPAGAGTTTTTTTPTTTTTGAGTTTTTTIVPNSISDVRCGSTKMNIDFCTYCYHSNIPNAPSPPLKFTPWLIESDDSSDEED